MQPGSTPAGFVEAAAAGAGASATATRVLPAEQAAIYCGWAEAALRKARCGTVCCAATAHLATGSLVNWSACSPVPGSAACAARARTCMRLSGASWSAWHGLAAVPRPAAQSGADTLDRRRPRPPPVQGVHVRWLRRGSDARGCHRPTPGGCPAGLSRPGGRGGGAGRLVGSLHGPPGALQGGPGAADGRAAVGDARGHLARAAVPAGAHRSCAQRA